ncbi:MAG: nucleotidyl transferase AbiEii/AbiGii toxin family protein [Actinobacteria bacterium]|jgi:hypothetical protein|nr:nucleotidyl transferase AbiEii/AbiGii toxin family protein [Actinomycetota bacterium]
MSRPTRQTPAGRAYLDIQNRARREGSSTQNLLTLYVVERWLARLADSPYAEQFVLKGGMLLAAFDARRPTADADALARNMANDQDTILARVIEIARLPDTDGGVEFLPDTATARTIRDEALYAGVRIAMDARLATAAVKFRLDVNFGDPITPAPRRLTLPSIRPDTPPVTVLGYPIETVLAEKIATAITLGAANTRIRDYADIYTLTGQHDLTHAVMHEALHATATFRQAPLVPLSTAVDNLVELRQAAYRAYRDSLDADGEHLPDDLGVVVDAVTTFADPLIQPAARPATTWQARHRRWTD